MPALITAGTSCQLLSGMKREVLKSLILLLTSRLPWLKKESGNTIDKIIEAMKMAITEVYEEARKNGGEVVIADKNGKAKKIKPV